jgi:hypothetical protein
MEKHMRFNSRLGLLVIAFASLPMLANCSSATTIPDRSGASFAMHSPISRGDGYPRALLRMILPPRVALPAGSPKHARPWFGKAGASENVLFLSDYDNNDITMFDVKTKAVLGVITAGLNYPAGLSTRDGKLYVANTIGENIAVFSAPYTNAPTTLDDSGNNPAGVHVDKAGNVWVANIGSTTSTGQGNVVEYPTGSAQPRTLDMKGSCFYCSFVTTDAHGNVWVDGQSGGHSILGYWTHGQGRFHRVSVSFGIPGGIAFDKAGNLLLVDQQGDGYSSELLMFPPHASKPSKTYRLLVSDAVTIALGNSDRKLYASDATEAIQPFFHFPNLQYAGQFVEPQGFIEVIGVATLPNSNP